MKNNPCQPWHSYLKIERAKRGWSLIELEAVTGIGRAKLYKIESRTAVPSLVQAYRLAETYSAYPEDLFNLDTGFARTIREINAPEVRQWQPN